LLHLWRYFSFFIFNNSINNNKIPALPMCYNKGITCRIKPRFFVIHFISSSRIRIFPSRYFFKNLLLHFLLRHECFWTPQFHSGYDQLYSVSLLIRCDASWLSNWLPAFLNTIPHTYRYEAIYSLTIRPLDVRLLVSLETSSTNYQVTRRPKSH